MSRRRGGGYLAPANALTLALLLAGSVGSTGWAGTETHAAAVRTARTEALAEKIPATRTEALVAGIPVAIPATRLAQTSSCTIFLLSINFGDYDTQAAAPQDSEGAVVYTCRGASPPAVTIQIGAGVSGRIADRAMQGPAGSLRYNLYLDALRQTVWGDGSQGSRSFVSTNNPVLTPVRVPVYARVPARQAVGAGQYQDSLAVTIIF